MTSDPQGARPIEEVLREHTPGWLALPGVVGTAIGEHDGQRCIKVFVASMTDQPAAEIPPAAEGYRIVVEQTGEFRAL